VAGDGLHTIAQLVEQVNQDPRRGSGHSTSLTKIRFDDIAKACLASQGLTDQSIPTKGQRVHLRNNANLSTGGSATDVTDDVHPEVAARAVDAAHMVGLDICGVDIVSPSILRPLEAQGGGVVEVNAAPGLRMHLAPSFGKGRAVGEAIISSLFKPGETGRIPIIAVTGTNGKTTTVRLISHLLTHNGMRVGMTNTDGVYVEGQCIDTGDCSGPKSARNVLMHPDVDAAVLETARGGILREGLAFDRCDVAVVTNIGSGDHLGLNYITTVDELAVLKRVIVQNVAATGVAVLNAADPQVAAMASKCKGAVTFFAADHTHPVMLTHRAQGHAVVFVQDGHIVASKAKVQHRIALSNIPVTMNGAIGFQVANVMACVAAAWALQIDWDTIEKGLASFSSDTNNAAGRFNLFKHQGATVIADYGHNPDAMAALVQAVESMPAKRRSVVISGPGDRRDQDIRQQTEILGNVFDEIVMFEDQCQRGRQDGEVITLLKEGLQKAQRAQERHEIYGEFAAIDLAMDKLQAGELCLILVDQVEEAMAHIAAKATGN
jgi:cyanophycin synthetase